MDERSEIEKFESIRSPKTQKLCPITISVESAEGPVSTKDRKKGFRKITTKRNEMSLERALYGHSNLKDLDSFYE